VRERKKVAQRRFDGRSRLTVPVATKNGVAVVCQLWKSQRAIEMRNAPWAVVFQQDSGLTWIDDKKVSVAAAPIPRGGAATARAGGREE
jgi:hypothetical protein